MSISGIIENIIADFIFIVLSLVLGWILITITRRKRLQNFFGVSYLKRLIIYLSDIRVLIFGSTGITGQMMSYEGSAVAYGEMESANRIRNIFSFIIPSISDSLAFMKKLLLSDILVELLISPSNENKIDTEATLISLGSSAYNIASKYIENTCSTSACFRFGLLKKKDIQRNEFNIFPTSFSTDVEMRVSSEGTTNIYETPLSSDTNEADEISEKHSAILIKDIPEITDSKCGFIQRTTDDANKRKLFYIAGLSEYATIGCANYLVLNWHTLYKKYGKDKSFIIILRFGLDINNWAIENEIVLL
jgi:hypothetical protein